MKHYRFAGMAIALISLIGCSKSPVPSESAPALAPKTITLDETITVVVGQTVYVPVYSYIYMFSGERVLNLTATLSVRNTDRKSPIIVKSVTYYDEAGVRVRNYLDQPIALDPLAATEFVVEQSDIRGGSGASFLVEWIAQAQVSDPVVEAVMINTSGNQGVSFVTLGRVIERINQSEN